MAELDLESPKPREDLEQTNLLFSALLLASMVGKRHSGLQGFCKALINVYPYGDTRYGEQHRMLLVNSGGSRYIYPGTPGFCAKLLDFQQDRIHRESGAVSCRSRHHACVPILHPVKYRVH